MDKNHILAIERIFGENTDRWLIGVYEWEEEEELNCDEDLLFRESISRAVDNFIDEESGEVDSLQSLLRCFRRQCARLELAIEEYSDNQGKSVKESDQPQIEDTENENTDSRSPSQRLSD